MRMFVPNEKPAVALLQLNRQIHHEALPSLYSKNLWRLSYQTDPLLPRTIFDNEQNRHLLRHISVCFDYRDVTKCSHDAIISHFALNIQASGQSSPADILRREKDIKGLQKVFFLVACGWKLNALEHLRPQLLTISMDFLYVADPLVHTRKSILQRIAQRPSSLWALGRLSDPSCRTLSHEEQTRMNDPVSAPAGRRRYLITTGLWPGERELLFR